jgi:hypothetical protein
VAWYHHESLLIDTAYPNKSLESIQSHLKQWYRSRAKVIFEVRLQRILEQALWDLVAWYHHESLLIDTAYPNKSGFHHFYIGEA